MQRRARTVRQRRKSSVARSECYLHKRDKTRPTIWRSIKVTDSVPGRRHGDPESSSELVNRPLSSLTTSNVPCPSRPSYRLSDARVATAVDSLSHSLSLLSFFHFFCSQPKAIEFFLRKTNLVPLHTHTQSLCTCVYLYRVGVLHVSVHTHKTISFYLFFFFAVCVCVNNMTTTTTTTGSKTEIHEPPPDRGMKKLDSIK